MRIFYTNPFIFWLRNNFLVFIGNCTRLIVNTIPDIDFVLQYVFYLGDMPRIFFIFFCINKDMRKCSVSLKIDPSWCRHLFTIQYPANCRSTLSLDGKLKDLYNDPFCFIINNKLIFYLRMSLIADRRMRTDIFSSCKLHLKNRLDFSTRIFRVPLIEQVFERNKI